MGHRWLVSRGMVVVVGLLLGALVGGLYGALHDQLSYTLCPDFFTRFKFIQFWIHWGYESPRLGAAWVGFRATWWLGAWWVWCSPCLPCCFIRPAIWLDGLPRPWRWCCW